MSFTVNGRVSLAPDTFTTLMTLVILLLGDSTKSSVRQSVVRVDLDSKSEIVTYGLIPACDHIFNHFTFLKRLESVAYSDTKISDNFNAINAYIAPGPPVTKGQSTGPSFHLCVFSSLVAVVQLDTFFDIMIFNEAFPLMQLARWFQSRG